MAYSGLATLTGDGIRFSNILAIVPLEYMYGIGPATQIYLQGEEAGIDRNLNTVHNMDCAVGISHERECKPEFLMIAGWSGLDAGIVYCQTDDVNLQFRQSKGDWAHTRNNTSTYSFPSVSGIVKDGNGDLDMFLYRINTGQNPEGLRHLLMGNSATTHRDSCFSLNLHLRMYNSLKTENVLGDIVRGGRTSQGMLNPNFALVKSLQWIKKHSFEWKELTEDEYNEFVEFFTAFGGNIGAGWFLCRQNGDMNNSMEAMLLFIEPKSVNIKYVPKDGTWDVSFSAVEGLINIRR